MSIQSPPDRNRPSLSPLAACHEPHGAEVPLPVGKTAPSVVYLLADHLDAVLARGEDLLACSWRPDRTARCPATIASHQVMQRDIVRTVRTHELLLISRALKARERSRELASIDGRFGSLARVFAAATVSLEEAAKEAGDLSSEQFDAAHGILAYLRSRGVVAKDKAEFDDCGAIVITPKFLVAKRIELNVILDLVAAFLDALELHYDIYPVADAEEAPRDPVSPRETAPQVLATAAVPDADEPCVPSARTAGESAVPASSLIERLSSAQQT